MSTEFENVVLSEARSDLLAPSEPSPPPLETSVNGNENGRGKLGKFAEGNKFGKGNPLARKAAMLRSALFRAIDRDDMASIIAALVAKAAKGDVAAAKLVLQYTLGDPESLDLIQTVTRLEALILKGIA